MNIFHNPTDTSGVFQGSLWDLRESKYALVPHGFGARYLVLPCVLLSFRAAVLGFVRCWHPAFDFFLRLLYCCFAYVCLSSAPAPSPPTPTVGMWPLPDRRTDSSGMVRGLHGLGSLFSVKFCPPVCRVALVVLHSARAAAIRRVLFDVVLIMTL